MANTNYFVTDNQNQLINMDLTLKHEQYFPFTKKFSEYPLSTDGCLKPKKYC